MGQWTATRSATYVAGIRVPELKSGDIVIMDNLPAHRVSGVRETIE